MDYRSKYVIRRSGQVVGTYEDKETALTDSRPGDSVFERVETHGDYGCITEHRINKPKGA